jgi:PAS domain S-box-containing protein
MKGNTILPGKQIAAEAGSDEGLGSAQSEAEGPQQRLRIQEQLLETARYLTASLDVEQVLYRIANTAREMLAAYGCAVYLLEPDKRMLRPVIAIEPPHEAEILATPLDVADSFTGQAVQAGRALIFNDAFRNPLGYEIPGTPKNRDERVLVAPFVVEEQVSGAICLNRTGRFFSDEDLALAETFAAYASTVLKNAHTLEALQREVQERRSVEAALRVERDRAQRYLDIAGVILVALNTSGEITLLNRKGHAILGYGEGELLGRNWFNTCLPEHTRAAVQSIFEQLIAGDVALTEEFENPILTKSGEERNIAWQNSLLTDETGQIIGTLSSGRDITERVQAGQALRRRNRELALLIQVIAAATSTLDGEQVLEIACKGLAEAFDVPVAVAALLNASGSTATIVAEHLAPGRASLFGGPEPVVNHPELRERLEQQGWLALVLTAQQPSPIRQHMQALGAQSALIVPIPVARGRIAGVLVMYADEPRVFGADEITLAQNVAATAGQAVETARLYQALQRNIERLEETVARRTLQLQAQYARVEAILRSTADGIMVADGQGEIVQTNPVAHQWLHEVLDADDAEQLRETVRHMVAQVDSRPETVLEFQGLDLQLNAAPIVEPGLQDAEAVVAAHDVCHLKELDRIKSRLISYVSHELRTPITTIKLYLGLMRRNPAKAEQYLQVLDEVADRQAHLVEDILQVSRIDAGRLEIQPRPLALDDLLDAAVANHYPLAEERELRLERRDGAAGAVAMVDPDQFMQVVNNLVLNAVRYTPAGGRIEVSASCQENTGQAWATLTVADTGIGIPAEELPHVFERFYRGSKPQQMQIEGTGLGLAIAKEIVELHGGRVTVESQVDQGTTFTVWLPCVDQDTDTTGR